MVGGGFSFVFVGRGGWGLCFLFCIFLVFQSYLIYLSIGQFSFVGVVGRVCMGGGEGGEGGLGFLGEGVKITPKNPFISPPTPGVF